MIKRPFSRQTRRFLHHNNPLLQVLPRFCLETSQTRLAAKPVSDIICPYLHLILRADSKRQPVARHFGTK
jgi:hypothetical protein